MISAIKSGDREWSSEVNYSYIRLYGCQPKNRGGPPKWMVHNIMENPIKIDDLGGPPLFLETPIYYILNILKYYIETLTPPEN